MTEQAERWEKRSNGFGLFYLSISHHWPEGVSASEYAMPEALIDRIIADHDLAAERLTLVRELVAAQETTDRVHREEVKELEAELEGRDKEEAVATDEAKVAELEFAEARATAAKHRLWATVRPAAPVRVCNCRACQIARE